MQLFLTSSFGSYIPGLVLRRSKLWRLYADGEQRLDKEFDIVKIIKSIRNLKIISKATIMSKFIATKVKNDGNNIIDIDSDGADVDDTPLEMYNEDYSDEIP